MKYQNNLIVGGGLLGEELNYMIKKNGGNSTILKNIEYNNQNIIPEKIDTVFVVAQSSDYKKNPMTKDLLYVNTILPLQIAMQAIEKDVKNFVYFSTGSIYQNSVNPHKEEEQIEHSTNNPYVATKLSSEILLNSWKEKFEKLFIFRPFFMYGSGQNEQQIFPRMINSIKMKEKIQLANNLGLIFNPIHVFDAARFILETVENQSGFNIFNIAGKEKISLKDVVDKISKKIGSTGNIEISNANEATVLGSIEKMEKINFEFKINMNDGIEELISKKRNSELFIS
jgi:nucleoside-diphosphate-sugar epimerase